MDTYAMKITRANFRSLIIKVPAYIVPFVFLLLYHVGGNIWAVKSPKFGFALWQSIPEFIIIMATIKTVEILKKKYTL